MTDLEFRYLLCLGRFQVPHFGHFNLITRALELSENVIIGLGSANRARSPKNPLKWQERKAIFENCGIDAITQAIKDDRIVFMPVEDSMYDDDRWVQQVIASTERIAGSHRNKLGLIGHTKDESSYYLELFRLWPYTEVPMIQTFNSTDLRSMWMSYGAGVRRNTTIGALTTTQVISCLEAYTKEQWFKDLQSEVAYISAYKDSWTKAPYPVKHVTVDSVVTAWDGSGKQETKKILLVNRKGFPGKGLLALPGGHLNEFEYFRDGAIRELKEETGITIEDSALRTYSKKHPTVFGSPDRSPLGRVITHAFVFDLPYYTHELKVKGMDDAESANWYDPSELRCEDMHDDHWFIIRELTGLV